MLIVVIILLLQDTNPGEDSFVLLWVVAAQASMRDFILDFEYVVEELLWF